MGAYLLKTGHRGGGVLKALVNYWSEDRSLSAMLGMALLMMFVVIPFCQVGLFNQLVLQVTFTLLLVSGVFAATRSRTMSVLVIIISALDIVCGWTDVVVDSRALTIAGHLLSISALGLLVAVVLKQTVREGPINSYRIRGAIATFLLIALLWVSLYDMIDFAIPGAFDFRDGTGESRKAMFLYYSLVTLTTVGYGDIVPVHRAARTAATAEALIGQLFPAILIARLVSMELYYRQSRKAGGRDKATRADI